MPGPNRQRHKTAKYVVSRNPHSTRKERRLRKSHWWLALAALVGVRAAQEASKRGRAKAAASRQRTPCAERKRKAARKRSRIARARTFNWKRKGV
jgi:hypothetical protein